MTYTVGLIGCGRVAHAHGLGWREAPGADLVAIADINPVATERFGSAFGISADHRYDNYQELLEREHPDVVIVCLWAQDHLEVAAAALPRGAKLVISEKPMAPDLADAQSMIMAASEAGAKLAVGHQRRFYPAWEAARDEIARGVIGEPLHGWTSVTDCLMDNATHSIDCIRYILSDPVALSVVGAIHRSTDRFERGAAVEDSALGLVIFGNGTRLTVESDITPSGSNLVDAWLFGAEGTMRIVENEVRVLGRDETGWRPVPGAKPVEPTWAASNDSVITALRGRLGRALPGRVDTFLDTFVRQAQEATAWLDGDVDDFRGDARHGYAALEIVLAMYESARLQEVTELPLQTRANPLELMIDSGQLQVTRPGPYDIRVVKRRRGSVG